MPLENGQPFQPLTEDAAMTETAWKSTIYSILESYNSSYDCVMEMAQNAMDAIDVLLRGGLIDEGKIQVTVDLEGNTVQIIDNGVGMDINQLSKFFRPNVSFKVRSRTSGEALRGYKGVGATYLSYGFATIHVATKRAGNDVISYRLSGGRRWVDDEDGHEVMPEANPYIENDPYFAGLEHGTLVRIRLDRDSHPTSPSNIGGNHRSTTGQRWKEILQTRTAIGQIVPWGENGSNVKFKLVLKSGVNIVFESDWGDAIYGYKHDKEAAFTTEYLDLERFILQQGGGERPNPRYTGKNGIFLTYDTETLAQKLPDFQDFIRENNAWCYGVLGYTKDMFGLHMEGKIPKGVAIATQGMLLGKYEPIQLTRYTGLADRMLVLVHFDNVSSDTGRKTVMSPAPEVAQEIAKSVHKSFTAASRFKIYLRNSGGGGGRRRGGDGGGVLTPHRMKVQSEQYLQDYPLLINDIFSKCEPSHEQDVVSLFAQLCTADYLKGYSSIRSFEGNWTYDGIFSYSHSDDETFSYSEGNRLGLTAHNRLRLPLGDNDPAVLEFKFNLDDVVDEFSDEEHPKQASEVQLLVAWDSGESFVEGAYGNFLLRECCSSEGNLANRFLYGQTHTLVSQGTEIPVLLLKYVIGIISQDNERYIQILNDNFNPE